MDWIKNAAGLFVVAVTLTVVSPALSQEAIEDLSVEQLYEKAGQLAMFGNNAEAAQLYGRMVELSGGHETLFEDYGSQAGGIFFDYGMTLLPLQRWEEAREAFDICVRSDEIADFVESPIKSKNARMSLGKFQLGFCEAQLGDNERALQLYEEYLGSNPDPNELKQVYASYKLRVGGALMKVGRTAEGIAAIQELFDTRETKAISPQFLMQGILELGLAWTEKAKEPGVDDAELEKIEEQVHDFLDMNASVLNLSTVDQYRFGFVERLRKLGFESTKVGLYTSALRYFSLSPTLADVKKDLELALARQDAGVEVPAHYQQLLNKLAESEKAPLHPDAEALRVQANCYVSLENYRAGRVIYWNLVEQFPTAPAEARSEILHEAARLSSMLGDYPAAQYFGEMFEGEMPDDHELRNNVSTFMLQSLFTAKDYAQVISISETVRGRFEEGSSQRELADFLYPMALYATQMHEEAQEPFAEYVKAFPEGGNIEPVMFHRGSNLLILGKMRDSAEKYEEFLVKFPDSEQFLDRALADLTIGRFNLEDYPAAIAASEQLQEKRPESVQLGRTVNITGDAYLVQAGSLPKGEDEQKAEWRLKARENYIKAYEVSRVAQSSDSERTDYHKSIASEGLWKATDLYYQDGEIEKGIELYDAYFPDYVGTYYEPQISVFSLEHLESVDRGEEGLVQVEKMILLLGGKPPEQQDLTLLRQAIGSYSEASVRIRGVETTVATLGEFPGMDPANQALFTWLKIQQVIVLQESRKGVEKDTPEYAVIEGQIGGIFEELRKFEKRNLSEFALREIGRYFAGTDNPFLGVPYFEELLARTNPEADVFKGLAEMELGLIEMRAADPGKIQAARERFRRVIDVYKDAELVPEAHMNLAKLFIKNKEWKDALAELGTINKQKNFFKGDRAKRAEAGFLMGTVFDELGDPGKANQSYLAVVSTYGGFSDWVTQAWERYIPNSLADFEKMPASTEEEQLDKRKRELALYKLTRKFLIQWSDWTDEVAPSGALRRLRRDIEEMKSDLAITPEEEQQVLFDLGLIKEK